LKKTIKGKVKHIWSKFMSAITGVTPNNRCVAIDKGKKNVLGILVNAVNLDRTRGLGSAIALAPDENDRGLLTAEEILDLHLNADLVVLSACNTGLGRITGDGAIGLSRALIAAGTPSAIVSLWAVPDATTADLMVKFYQNLDRTGNKAQALRNAMLETMQQHPNPRDWAAFTAIGET
jgi:CHAT domain-containing protein